MTLMIFFFPPELGLPMSPKKKWHYGITRGCQTVWKQGPDTVSMTLQAGTKWAQSGPDSLLSLNMDLLHLQCPGGLCHWGKEGDSNCVQVWNFLRNSCLKLWYRSLMKTTPDHYWVLLSQEPCNSVYLLERQTQKSDLYSLTSYLGNSLKLPQLHLVIYNTQIRQWNLKILININSG